MKSFPIQGDWNREKHCEIKPSSIPWDLIAAHDAQARKNHAGQGVERLAERHGCSPCEVCAILEDRPWRSMGQQEALDALAAHVLNFNSRT